MRGEKKLKQIKTCVSFNSLNFLQYTGLPFEGSVQYSANPHFDEN